MIKTLFTRLISEKNYRKLCKSHKFNIIGIENIFGFYCKLNIIIAYQLKDWHACLTQT